MTIAEPCAGTITPVAPAPSALRATAPRLRGSVTRSRQTSSGLGCRASSKASRVSIRLDARDDALVVASAGGVGQLALGLDLDARPAVLAQPLLGVQRALGRPQLEHLARSAQRFPNRAPPVDLLCGHRFGTSW